MKRRGDILPHPSASSLALIDIGYYTDLARKAEAGLFDSVFLADQLALGEDAARAPRIWLELITVLAALAGATNRIGLIATCSTTCSTTCTEPFNLARQFASLDHISGGRVGWNIVTTWLAAAADYGGRVAPKHAERYERAEEYMRVVTSLWDSWSDNAVVDDRARGQYSRACAPSSAHYQVAGPLNMPRGPQGRPIFVQAGSSATGRGFAARYHEAVFTAQMDKAAAKDFYADLQRLAAAEGGSGQVLILSGMSPVIGSTEAEAQRLAGELNDLSDPEVGRKRLI